MTKIALGVVIFACVSVATSLVAWAVLKVAPGNNTLAVLAAGAFFVVGSLLVLSWMNRQAKQWWDRF
jgi:hypothetical protein